MKQKLAQYLDIIKNYTAEYTTLTQARLHQVRTAVELSWQKKKLVWPTLKQTVPPKDGSIAADMGLLKARSRRNRTAVTSQLRMAKLLHYSAVAALVMVVCGVIGFFALFAYYSKDMPSADGVFRTSGFSTRLYDRNGKLLYDLYDEERRTPVSIEEVPDFLKQATVAIEDKDFYKHGGFDPLTIVRIPYNYVVRKQVVGGSTLTQQLVKNALLTNERSVQRKFKELVLSMQIERKFSKDKILEMYLNENPYGGTAWGVGTAAELYFDKDVSELSRVESAILAGLPQRPSAYSPLAGRTDENGELLWKLRTEGVLRRMQEDGYITKEEEEQLVVELDSVTFSSGAVNINAPHFVFYVKELLEDQYGQELTEKGGFKVTTTLDMELQDQAQQIVSEEIDKVEDLNITNGAAMVVDPQTGEIISMIGSRGYNSDKIDGKFNVAVDGLRQPGSSIKPVTYLSLFQRGYTPASMLVDAPTTFQRNENDKPYEPNNYNGRFNGPVSLRNSLGSSLNITAVKGLAIVGMDHFLNQAYEMGFVTLKPTEENKQRFGLAVTLGGAEVHLIDTVTAYSAFANGGTKVEPVAILKIEDSAGNVLFEHKPVTGKQVMNPGEAFLINHVLSDDSARAMAFGSGSQLNLSSNVAVKTGTTNDARDNWAVGWSQEVMVGAWVGNNDNSVMKRVASGVSGATPIWRKIMEAALESGYGTPEWEIPENVELITVDAVSGYPEHDGYAIKRDYAIKGTVPDLPDPIHTKLKVCKDENKLATDARIASGDYEEKEFFVLREDDPYSEDGTNRWQIGIQAWIDGQGDDKYKAPTEYCGDQTEVYVNLKRPKDKHSYDEEDIEVEVTADSGDGIEKIEIFVDGEKVETINDNEYKGKITMKKGRHEVYAKATSRSGETDESSKRRIGTGGEDWEEPEPTPTPEKPEETPTPDTPSISPNATGSGGFIPPGLNKDD